MKVKLPQYSGKDYLVMAGIVPTFTLFINFNIFSYPYFSNWRLFVPATLITGVGFCLDFILCGWIAVVMKDRFPNERQLIKRLASMILIFLLLTGLFLYSLFQAYEQYFFFSYNINEVGFIWSYFSMGIVNVFLTFLMEGISRYQTWKNNWEETEKLKKTYNERQLQGLKTHLNQHFLFDNLNALSSFIQKEGDEAEKFLNEMSKVYRYMLRIDEEPLVTVDTELRFIESYRHLLLARYAGGLQLEVDISNCDKDKWLLPLSLQLIVESTFSLNHFDNINPLKISICSDENNVIKIINNLQPKHREAAKEYETGLDKLVNNYRLFTNSPMVINDSEDYRVIHLPLIVNKEKKEGLHEMA